MHMLCIIIMQEQSTHCGIKKIKSYKKIIHNNYDQLSDLHQNLSYI